MLTADELKTARQAAMERVRVRAKESVEICRQLDLRIPTKLTKFVQISVLAAQGKQRVAIKEEARKIYGRNVGNFNRDGVQRQIIEMRQRLVNENAADVFSIYCEAWNLAGKKKSAAFIRFVRDAKILPLIASQTNGVLRYLRSSALRAGTKQGSLPSSFGNLRKEWHDKLETEALKMELQDSAQSKEQTPPAITLPGRTVPFSADDGGDAEQSLTNGRGPHTRWRGNEEDADRRQQSNTQPKTARATIGRPRKDDDRKRVTELRAEKKSWGEIAIIVNRETGQNKTKDAYRRLCQHKTKQSPPSRAAHTIPAQN